MTLAQALLEAQVRGLSRLDAQRLLLHALARSPDDRAWLISHDQDPLPEAAAASFERLCQRHADDEPMGYLLGEQAFFDLNLHVDARVLVPRPDTEVLVNWALDCWPPGPAPQVLDLGTGSGAIALALARQHPNAEVHASDRSADALAVAQANAHRLGLALHWHQGHWWKAVAGQRFDLVVSNPPYIAEHDPHLSALRHEPRQALTAGPSGLDDLHHIIDGAAAHLQPGAWLLLEHGHDQGQAVAQRLSAAGFEDVAQRQDLAGHVRCTGGRWPHQHKPG